MPESITFENDGPVHVVEHGGAGRTILLVHGLGGSHVNWSAVAGPLTAYGSVRAIDLIGFGRTPLADRSARVQAQRDLVISYLRQNSDGPAVLIGNSMGGLVSLLVAEQAPDVVDALVLVDPALPTIKPRFDPGVLRSLALPLVPGVGQRVLQNLYATALEDPDAYLEQTLAIVAADPTNIQESDREQAKAMAQERATMPWAGDAFVQAAKSIFGVVARRRSFASMVETIEAPALHIHGDLDRLVDIASAHWLAEHRPDWTLEVLEGVGHVPQLEVPDQFVDLVAAWLAAHPVETTAS